MSMLKNKRNLNNNKKNLKKSQILLFGSLLIFLGGCILSFNYFYKLRNEIFSDMLISLSDVEKTEKVEDVPVTKEVKKDKKKNRTNTTYKIDYSKYLGVLRIPKINLKRGFYGTNSKYNTIEYNVTMLKGSDLPDVTNGNLILIAHSGDAYISYFRYLYKLKKGDMAYVTYNGTEYAYKIVKIYNEPKTGVVTVNRNYNKTTLTLITCTKDSDKKQTIYIAELQ